MIASWKHWSVTLKKVENRKVLYYKRNLLRRQPRALWHCIGEAKEATNVWATSCIDIRFWCEYVSMRCRVMHWKSWLQPGLRVKMKLKGLSPQCTSGTTMHICCGWSRMPCRCDLNHWDKIAWTLWNNLFGRTSSRFCWCKGRANFDWFCEVQTCNSRLCMSRKPNLMTMIPFPEVLQGLSTALLAHWANYPLQVV